MSPRPKAFEAADAELNEVSKKVLAAIEAGGASTPSAVTAADAAQWKADLIQAQEAWNTFKDKDCNGARSYEYWGGSGRGLAVTSCLYVYTVTRTDDLKARYLSD
jgi:uncharacterized protein YecT (DUF1311 family)